MIDRIQQYVAPHGLMVMGHLPHPQDATLSIFLIGADRDFWSKFTHSPEYTDGFADPIDRWSKRIIGRITDIEGGDSMYPSDGPPYAPFIAWAEATGRFWQSPTGMLVHDHAGLLISIRGALILRATLSPNTSSDSPCDTCAERPCVTACPVNALSDTHFYDVPSCKAHIASQSGHRCMSHGCATRLACPLSQSFDRPIAQSAFHMRAFKG